MHGIDLSRGIKVIRYICNKNILGERFMINLYQELINEQKIVSVYTNIYETTKFLCGYPLRINENHFLLASITPQGYYDGYIVKNTNSIYHMTYDEKYELNLAILARYYQTTHKKIKYKYNLIYTLLNHAKENNFVISIELFESGYDNVVGMIGQLSQDYCEILRLTEYGELDGVSKIKLCDISQIACDTEDEIKIKILYYLKNNIKGLN